MKKIYLLLFALVAGCNAFAQSNAGMETWRSGSAGTLPSVAIHAPAQWFGFDSLVIAEEEGLLPLFFAGYMPTNLHAQLFQETTIVHSGTSSAKIVTLKQDTIGMFAGILSNAKANLNTTELIATMNLGQSLTLSGGTPVTGRIASVSAWVRYTPGKDSTGATGIDSGTFVVTVYSQVSGVDSAVGTVTLKIGPTATWTQVTAPVVYADSVDGADTVRIQFASSGQIGALDSSTLYVDDVSMTYLPNAVKNVNLQNDVKVYPNPASGILYVEGADNAGANFRLYAMNGQLVANKTLTSKDAIDISTLSDGLYFYTISDVNGNTTQRGKVSVLK